MTQLIINDEPRQVAGAPSITALLRLLDIAADEVAVEHNLAIVPASRWNSTILHDGDRIEIVRFVGGG